LKTLSLIDEREKAQQQVADADQNLAQLEQQRAKLVVDIRLGDADARLKLKAVEDQIGVVERDRDRARLAVTELERREKERQRKEEQAKDQRVINRREAVLNDRGVVLARLLKAIDSLHDDVVVYLRLTADIDGLTTHPAIGGRPSRSRSRLTNWLFARLGKDGGANLDEIPFVPAQLRVPPTNEP
jgi:septation ring formation regulator EzrA